MGLIGAFQDLGKLGVSHLSLTCFGKQAQGGSDVAQGDELPEPIVDVLIVIDPNSFLGEVNIQKRELCVKGVLSQYLGLVWGSFQRGLGGFSG